MSKNHTLIAVNTRLSQIEGTLKKILGGCYTLSGDPCCSPDGTGIGNVDFINVRGKAGTTIIDDRLRGWDVALIAIDNQHPRNTGYTKTRATNRINLSFSLSGGETITLFLFKSVPSPVVIVPPPSSLFPYQFPIVWGSSLSGFPYSLPISFS